MALGLNTETASGDFTPILKYDARAGRMFRPDRVQENGNWVTNNIEVTSSFQAIFDLDNIEVGWALLANGVAPSWSMVKLGDPMPAKPSDQHKQCFRVMAKLGKTSGGDLREFASQAKVVIGAVDKLHEAFLAERPTHPNRLPVVVLKGTTPVTTTGKGQSSTNYRPIFEIVKWADRPPELGGVSAVAASSAAPAPAPAMADDEF